MAEAQNIKLPDGRTVEIPADASPDLIAKLHDKLATKYPATDITNAAEMSTRGPARKAPTLPVESDKTETLTEAPLGPGKAEMMTPAGGFPVMTPISTRPGSEEETAKKGGEMQAAAGQLGMTSAGILTNPVATAEGMIGAHYGKGIGGSLGEMVGPKGKVWGERIGAGLGALGGGLGGRAMNRGVLGLIQSLKSGAPAEAAEEFNIPAAKAEMEKDILSGRHERMAAYDQMERELAQRSPVYGPTRINETPGQLMPVGAHEPTEVYGPTRVNPEEGGSLGVISKRSGSPAATAPKMSEGRPATWTNERLVELAKKGNRAAIDQLKLRGIPLPGNVPLVSGGPETLTEPQSTSRLVLPWTK